MGGAVAEARRAADARWEHMGCACVGARMVRCGACAAVGLVRVWGCSWRMGALALLSMRARRGAWWRQAG